MLPLRGVISGCSIGVRLGDVTVRKAMRGADDEKRETWTGTADSGQGDSQRGDLEPGTAVGTTAGNVGTCGRHVGEAWNWNKSPGGDLSGRQRQDFDRYATVREEEKKTTTLF